MSVRIQSYVRLTHVPSGLSVTIGADRGQLRAKEIAMKALRSKIWAFRNGLRSFEPHESFSEEIDTDKIENSQ